MYIYVHVQVSLSALYVAISKGHAAPKLLTNVVLAMESSVVSNEWILMKGSKMLNFFSSSHAIAMHVRIIRRFAGSVTANRVSVGS